jgi:hypothetical protein
MLRPKLSLQQNLSIMAPLSEHFRIPPSRIVGWKKYPWKKLSPNFKKNLAIVAPLPEHFKIPLLCGKGEFENAPKGGPLWTNFVEVIILVVLQTMIQPRLRTKLSPFSERSHQNTPRYKFSGLYTKYWKFWCFICQKIPKNKRVMTEISWKLITFSLTEWWPFCF